MSKVLCAIALAIPVVAFTQAPADSISLRAKQLHDRAIGELEEFCVLFRGQILEIERVVQVILCCRTMRMSGTPTN